jgi:hypothetical protein
MQFGIAAQFKTITFAGSFTATLGLNLTHGFGFDIDVSARLDTRATWGCPQ